MYMVRIVHNCTTLIIGLFVPWGIMSKLLGLVLFIGAGFAAYLFFFRKKDKDAPPPRKTGPQQKAGTLSPETADRQQPARPAFPWQISGEQIHPAVEQISLAPLPEGVKLRELDDLSEQLTKKAASVVHSLAALPASFFELNDMLRAPESSARQIASLVATNPILSARILQAINSSYYGLTMKIDSVGRAITLLGFNNVRTLVLRESLRSALPRQTENRELMDRLWVHSGVVSACANFLGREVLKVPVQYLPTIGLFHDIGKFFLPLLKSRQEPVADLPSIIQEDKRYGINHAHLGSLIARAWNLPEDVAACVEYHHHPVYFPPESIPVAYRQASFIVCLSDCICQAIKIGDSDTPYPLRPEYFEAFGLSPDLKKIISSALVSEMEKARLAVESYLKSG